MNKSLPGSENFNSWMRKQFRAADMAAQERDFRDQIGAGKKAEKKGNNDE